MNTVTTVSGVWTSTDLGRFVFCRPPNEREIGHLEQVLSSATVAAVCRPVDGLDRTVEVLHFDR